jgi:hypothetical protein
MHSQSSKIRSLKMALEYKYDEVFYIQNINIKIINIKLTKWALDMYLETCLIRQKVEIYVIAFSFGRKPMF